MRTSSRIFLVAALISTWWACDSPSRPSPPALRELVITGPPQVAPGTTAQFTATARYSDGSSEDVTSRVSWRSSKPNVLQISNGTAQGISRGEAAITVLLTRASKSTSVIVLEFGLYRLAGRLSESGGRVAGAQVEVISGTGTGLQTTSDVNGSYALYGVAGPIRLRLSAVGFEERLQDVTVSSHTQQDYELKLLFPSLDVSGAWKLTLKASPQCSGTLPEATREREFTVTITQTESRLVLNPSSPTLNRQYAIDGKIYSDVVIVNLWYDDYYGDYSLLDRVSPTDWVGIRGVLQGTAHASSIEGSFTGAFDYYLTTANMTFPGQRTFTCAADPAFVLRRQ